VLMGEKFITRQRKLDPPSPGQCDKDARTESAVGLRQNSINCSASERRNSRSGFWLLLHSTTLLKIYRVNNLCNEKIAEGDCDASVRVMSFPCGINAHHGTDLGLVRKQILNREASEE